MAIFKALTFDGVNSLDYGIYITGEAVYNAPERAVEMVNIPGKNGALALDQGRFENIEVTYHAGCFADSQADFADKVMWFRNALASRYTYKRLTDEYHPDEYRLGLYKSGLDVDAVRYGTAGEFNIVFDCKPQRFLVDGDRAISPTELHDIQTATGELVTIESDGSLAVKSLEVSLSPIQAGSGTPSPSNVRPISGRTEVVTQRTGVNVWDEEWEKGQFNWTTGEPTSRYDAIRSKNFIRVNPSATYYVVTPQSMPSNNLRFCFYDENKEFVGRTGWFPIDWSNHTITTPANVHYMKFCQVQTQTYSGDISINCPSTDTDYHAYDGNTYTTALGRTVYGGTLDVVSGELVVTEGYIASYNGESLPSTWISDRDEYVAGTTPSIGAEVVYELATPQTIQLTPQQIDLLLGTNHLWSDGEITVEYGVHPYYNPTPFASKPLIKVTGTGTLGIGEYILAITGTASQTLYIDCETMEIYTLEGTVPTGASSLVSINRNDFPVLEPGTNYISVGSGITAVTITPRWWRI